ncbi:MAG: hypothetical protein ACXVHL_12720, partial [Solirubrobacteraceae bacterium]
ADVRERTLLIERAISAGRVAATKTHKARTVRLLEPLAADLREFRMAAGRPAADQLIFPGHKRSHWTKTTWDNWRERTFARLLASVGLAAPSPTTFATASRRCFCTRGARFTMSHGSSVTARG